VLVLDGSFAMNMAGGGASSVEIMLDVHKKGLAGGCFLQICRDEVTQWKDFGARHQPSRNARWKKSGGRRAHLPPIYRYTSARIKLPTRRDVVLPVRKVGLLVYCA